VPDQRLGVREIWQGAPGRPDRRMDFPGRCHHLLHLLRMSQKCLR
jgi:hypothetical protein